MKHYIIVKFNDTVSDKEKLLTEIKELFGKTTQIQGIRNVNVYPCCINRPNRYDVMIEMLMDKEALDVYDASEFHMVWKRDYACFLEMKAIFDCEE